MKQIQQLFSRLDGWLAALSKRERIMVLSAVFLVPVYLFAQLIYLPGQQQYEKLQAGVQKQQQQNVSLQEQLAQLATSVKVDPAAAQVAQIAQIRQQIASFDLFLHDSVAGLVPPDRMAGLLREMLHNNVGLTLISLKNLPAQPLMPAAAPQKDNAGSSQDDGGAKTDAVNLYRHGIELKFSGSYLATLKYLKKLQALAQRIFWDGVTIEMSTSYPRAEVTLNVYTLSPEKGWIGG